MCFACALVKYLWAVLYIILQVYFKCKHVTMLFISVTVINQQDLRYLPQASSDQAYQLSREQWL